METKECPKCYQTHTKPGTFCSRSCANSRGPRTEEFKSRVSKKLTGRKLGRQVEWITLKCCSCNQKFEVQPSSSKRRFCSRECSNRSQKRAPGGYRPGSGRSKSGYYKGIYCGSSYELVWCIHRLDHDLPFERFEGKLTNGDITYIPDFLIDGNTIVELKGYEQKAKTAKKTALAESLGYNVQVLYEKDLQEQFQYVNQTYDFQNVWELYDDYKPLYSYECDACKKHFSTDIRKKTKIKYCSRQCAGKGANNIQYAVVV